jgi:hypothetical protein
VYLGTACLNSPEFSGKKRFGENGDSEKTEIRRKRRFGENGDSEKTEIRTPDPETALKGG